jgi:hypothetical protein
VTTLPLPMGCIDLTTEPNGDSMRVRWTDAILGELVEVAAVSFEEMTEWERVGAPPESMIERRKPLDLAIAAAKARAEGLHRERSIIRREFPGFEFGEWG